LSKGKHASPRDCITRARAPGRQAVLDVS